MKNWMMAIVATTALFVTVGCDTRSENQKNADKIEDSDKQATSLAKQAIAEYDQLLTVSDMKSLSDVELDALRGKFMSTRQKFVESAKLYQKALDDAEKYKDGVKTSGKEGAQQNIKLIKTYYIEDIDYKIRRIDAYKLERNRKDKKED